MTIEIMTQPPIVVKPKKICWACGHVSTDTDQVGTYMRWQGGEGDVPQDECTNVVSCATRIDAQLVDFDAKKEAWPDYETIAKCRNTRDLMWWMHCLGNQELLDELWSRYQSIRAIEMGYGLD